MNFSINRTVLAFTLPVLLASCASGYNTFYRPAPNATPEAIASNRANPPSANPLLERTAPDTPDRILAAYAKRGFTMIGESTFNSGKSESESSALKQAKIVMADLVLVINPQYTGSVTTNIPLTTPTSSTSYTNGTATAYGAGGTVNAYGNSTTTTYGSKTTYIPMTVNRSDYGAVYFVKQKFTLGTFVRDLTDSERQTLESNQGVVVITVVDNTPAFSADVLVGDYIYSINDTRVSNQESYSRTIGELKGQRIKLTLIRSGQKVEKTIQLNT